MSNLNHGLSWTSNYRIWCLVSWCGSRWWFMAYTFNTQILNIGSIFNRWSAAPFYVLHLGNILGSQGLWLMYNMMIMTNRMWRSILWFHSTGGQMLRRIGDWSNGDGKRWCMYLSYMRIDSNCLMKWWWVFGYRQMSRHYLNTLIYKYIGLYKFY